MVAGFTERLEGAVRLESAGGVSVGPVVNGSLCFISLVRFIGLYEYFPASFSVVLSPPESVLFEGTSGEEIRG